MDENMDQVVVDQVNTESRIIRGLIRLFFSMVLLALGGACAGLMVALAPSAERKSPEETATPVEVLQVKSEQTAAVVHATGVVSAAQQVSMVPQVSGRIVSVSSALIPGGRFQKGVTLAQIDPRDYRLAIKQEESRVRQASLELELERGRGEIAEREWELLGKPEASADQASLVQRKPHLVTSEANFESAQSALERARLNLERTTLRAPFNAMVLQEQLDVGQVVGGASVATLIGTDQFWIEVSVPVEKLSVVKVPGVSAEEGSVATVTQNLGAEETIVRTGKVLGLAGQLDAQTRTARLLIGVEQPLDPVDGGLPLLPGAYVDVDIVGRDLPDVVRVPRSSVVDGGKVWVMDEHSKLAGRMVQVSWRGEEEAFITSGLSSKDQVILTPLSYPIEGMLLKVASEPATADAPDKQEQ